MANKTEIRENDNSSSEDEFYDSLSDLSKEADTAKDSSTSTSLKDGLLVDDSKRTESQSTSEDIKNITKTEDVKKDDKMQQSQLSETKDNLPNLDSVNDKFVEDEGSKEHSGAENADEECSSCSEDENEDLTKRYKQQANEGLAAEAAEKEETIEETDNLPKNEDPDGEEELRELEKTLSQEEKEERREEAQVLKKEGNDLYKLEEYLDAIYKYTEAIRRCPLSFKKERSIMFANRAACKIHLKQLEDGVKDCSKALDLHPHYMKVLLRRAQTYELLEKLDEALKDYQTALELDPGCHVARAACMRLPGEINERNEKLKAEMMDKLKDLGNMVLRPFGLSTNNFKVQQDPDTGSYSMNFVQNNKTNGK